MNKTLLLAGAAAMFAANAQALEVTPYVAARISYDFTRNNAVVNSMKIKGNDNTWGSHIAVGAKHGAFRLETEYNGGKTAKKKYKGEEIDAKINLKTRSLMVNAYYDINLCSRFTPYVGVGAGIAKLDLRGNLGGQAVEKVNTSNFAWQIGAGVSYAATDSMDVDFGYRYVDTGAAYVAKGDLLNAKLNTARHEIYAGIRYNF
ncbi:MAG: porin family protein [Alphaproteobacteria bacterium]|nr:porin family protein [Alphaproteobacteria bacterium]